MSLFQGQFWLPNYTPNETCIAPTFEDDGLLQDHGS